jgi:hypothetical protein
MFGHQLIRLAGERGVPAHRQVGVDACLHRSHPQLLQPARLRGDEGVVGQIGEHRATPQRERTPTWRTQ